MKTRLSHVVMVLGLLWVGGAALADEAPETLDPVMEREQITLQRTQERARFFQRQQMCNQRFAVTDCLIQARRERRELLDDLRRREILLNELDRQNSAIDALNRIQANLAPERQQDLAQQAVQAQQDSVQRQTRSDEKAAARSGANPVDAQATRPQLQANTNNSALENERAYLEKLEEARLRKTDIERRLRQKGKPAASLPVPN